MRMTRTIARHARHLLDSLTFRVFSALFSFTARLLDALTFRSELASQFSWNVSPFALNAIRTTR